MSKEVEEIDIQGHARGLKDEERHKNQRLENHGNDEDLMTVLETENREKNNEIYEKQKCGDLLEKLEKLRSEREGTNAEWVKVKMDYTIATVTPWQYSSE